jgi:hypothetical protein
MIHYMVLIKILHSLYLYHLVQYINNKHKNLHQHDINLFNLLLINYVIHYVLPIFCMVIYYHSIIQSYNNNLNNLYVKMLLIINVNELLYLYHFHYNHFMLYYILHYIILKMYLLNLLKFIM